MVTEKDVLLLCEFIQLKNKAQKKEVFGFKKTQVQKSELIDIYIFEQEKNNCVFVIRSKKDLPQEINRRCLEEVKGYIKQYICNNSGLQKAIVSGIGVDGLYAASIASDLKIEGIVFGSPLSKTANAYVTYYVGENEPVTINSEQVVFVQQVPLEECFDRLRSETFMFDRQRHVIKGSQSQYSIFCTWFYHNEVNIDQHIWNLFFSDSVSHERLIEKHLYTVLLKADELTQEKIKKALRNVMGYIGLIIHKYKQDFHSIYRHIDSMKYETLEDYICEIADVIIDEIAMKVKRNYKSVESILAGVSLMTVGKKNIDFESIGEAFIVAVDNMLDNEKVSIYETIKEEKETILQTYLIHWKGGEKNGESNI